MATGPLIASGCLVVLVDRNQMNNDLEEIAKRLECSNDYLVQRRMVFGSEFSAYEGGDRYRAVYLDLETTGLSPEIDEIIEIGMVPFTYGKDGTIFSAEEPFSMLREPSFPISLEVSKINNITNEMVKSKKIDPNQVFQFVENADLIIAHNASFDRKFLEKFCPEFMTKPWACSMTQVNWKEEGFDGNRLSYIASKLGFFYNAHRAVEDCQAGIEVLTRVLPRSKERAMSQLLSNARKVTNRIWAVQAPYDSKDVLKARGYRWNDGNDERPKAWYVDVDTKDTSTEKRFLESEIYRRQINLPVTKITAKDRFSERV